MVRVQVGLLRPGMNWVWGGDHVVLRSLSFVWYIGILVYLLSIPQRSPARLARLFQRLARTVP